MASGDRQFDYVFHWYLKTSEDTKVFNKFKALCAYNGVSVSDTLLELTRKLVKDSYPNIELVTFNQMIEEAKKENLPVTKMTLINYRRKGVLQDQYGPYWFSDGFNIFFDKNKVLAFLKERRENPNSPLVKEPVSERA